MEQGGSSRHSVVGVAIVVAILAFAWWLGRVCFSDQEAMRTFFIRFPFSLTAVVLIVSYVLSSFIPFDVKDILKVVSALIFGAWWSTLFIWVSELVNCVMLFHLARRLGRGWIERRCGLHGNDVRWVERMCGTWQIMLVRLVPVVPYRILDVGYGLTAVSFRRYFVISAIVSPARIFWLQFILAGVGGAVFAPEKLMQYFLAHPEVVRFGALYLVFCVIAAAFLGRRIK